MYAKVARPGPSCAIFGCFTNVLYARNTDINTVILRTWNIIDLVLPLVFHSAFDIHTLEKFLVLLMVLENYFTGI